MVLDVRCHNFVYIYIYMYIYIYTIDAYLTLVNGLSIWEDTILHIYIYIYIVIHRQTVSFYQNSSVWLDTQDARSRDRNPSNFMLD